jgi:dihydrolipoamide dehydrogenase
MYDAVILGGGPGGYLAAERLGRLNKKVLLAEEWDLGGTCLNQGCIPAKTLIHSAKQYAQALEAKKYGVIIEGAAFDWGLMQQWKNEVVEKLRAGLSLMMGKSGVETVSGRGEILEAPSGDRPGRVLIRGSDPAAGGADGSGMAAEARAILIAAGSTPVLPPIPGALNNPLVVDSAALLSAARPPRRLAVIGGGVIGVELAGLFSALGSEITVIEMMEEILPFMDSEQAPLLRRCLRKINFRLGCTVDRIEGGKLYFSGPGGQAESTEADLILMAAGRRPVLEGWGREEAGLEAGPKGVAVDERMRTSVPGIWAAGDVTGRSLLAHSAYRMGETAAADMGAFLEGGGRTAAAETSGNSINWDAIPWVVYGPAEAAGTGLTEKEARRRGLEIIKVSLPMRLSGRFAAENTFAGQGAVKLIADAPTRRILGIHAVGPYASEFIWGGALALEKNMTVEDLRAITFPHPTVGELIREAAWAMGE